MTTTTPSEIHEGIRRLCQKIGATGLPFYVPVVPEPTARSQFCFPNVDDKVRRNGGECVLGWCLWDKPTYWVEGEFHAIWRSPDGVFQCVSPHADGEQTLLFLPDKRRQYRGVPVANVRFSWPKDAEAGRYIKVIEVLEEFRIMHAVPGKDRQTYSREDSAVLLGLVGAQHRALQRLMQYRSSRSPS